MALVFQVPIAWHSQPSRTWFLLTIFISLWLFLVFWVTMSISWAYWKFISYFCALLEGYPSGWKNWAWTHMNAWKFSGISGCLNVGLWLSIRDEADSCDSLVGSLNVANFETKKTTYAPSIRSHPQSESLKPGASATTAPERGKRVVLWGTSFQ